MNIMSGNYAIAYADKDGKGFSNTEPWIDDNYGNDLSGCLIRAKEMIDEGFKDVIPFQFGKRKRESYSWKYVKQRKIESIAD